MVIQGVLLLLLFILFRIDITHKFLKAMGSILHYTRYCQYNIGLSCWIKIKKVRQLNIFLKISINFYKTICTKIFGNKSSVKKNNLVIIINSTVFHFIVIRQKLVNIFSIPLLINFKSDIILVFSMYDFINRMRKFQKKNNTF